MKKIILPLLLLSVISFMSCLTTTKQEPLRENNRLKYVATSDRLEEISNVTMMKNGDRVKLSEIKLPFEYEFDLEGNLHNCLFQAAYFPYPGDTSKTVDLYELKAQIFVQGKYTNEWRLLDEKTETSNTFATPTVFKDISY